MTEYTTSSEAIREYLTSRERTAHWIRDHFEDVSDDGNLLSPSAPPSIISDSDAPSFGPSDSDAESTNSLPPRMILRWNDGRPDVPISRDIGYPASRSQSRPRSRSAAAHTPSAIHHQPSHHSRSNGGSRDEAGTAVPLQPSRHAQTLSYMSGPLLNPPLNTHITPPPSPEHIVVLPSPQGEEPPQMASTSSSSSPNAPHPEYPLHSRTPTSHSAHHGFPPEGSVPHQPSQHHSIVSPHPQHAYNPSHTSRHTTRSPQLAYSQSQPLPAPHGQTRFYENHAGSRAPSQLPYNYSPPAIVYAPSSRHAGTRYAPPQIVYSPPSHSHNSHGSHSRNPTPGSIKYSHSAPLPQTQNPYHPNAGGPHQGQYPSLRGAPSHLSSTVVEEDPRDLDYSRSRSRGQGRSQSRNHRSVSKGGEMNRGRSPGRVLAIARSPSGSRSPTPPLSDAGSRTSGSTYYILPTPGQKVQIIHPGAPSMYTATSATRANHSPHSPHSPQSAGSKKPFFQRIFSIPKFASSIDSRGSSGSTGRKLHRRHTLGGPHLQQRQ
ncbi:hypothetical protein PHLCEN_2v671 [Hermanssonia centrifuga]|uniref:Uncharacterized protein n=1 Tax=Hermanssonia centrifuga TaxID=98765 RepID=A0A2R6S5A2_9APHY|nr:hypothetical protein PHLCEN_2v671 [Hermanssonia centrifuga]